MEHIVEATVRSELRNSEGYRMKVSCVELGLYIDGFRATPSTKQPDGWWIQPPANMVGGRWVKAVEFDTTKRLWQSIEHACERAIETYRSEDVQRHDFAQDVALTERDFDSITPEELDKGLEQAYLTFGPDANSQKAPSSPRKYHE